MTALLDKQQKAISRLNTLKVGALFMEAGTGKTRPAMELIKSVNGIDVVVWLTPFQTKVNLKAETDKWGGLDKELVIMGIETLSSSNKAYINLINTLHSKKCFLVVDESLKIKNYSAIRTKRIIELGKYCDYKLILNGTPITRNVLDLWAQFQFLSPKILLGFTESQFKNIFCEYTTIKKRIGNTLITKEFITKYHNIDYLYSLIKPYVYECDLELEIGKQYIECSFDLCEESRNKYQYLKDTYLTNEKMLMLNKNIFLEMCQKMQQEYCCTAEKFALLDKIVKANDSKKIIVYCKFIKSQEAVRLRYPSVLVHSYGKHAYGLNLQDKNIIVFWDKTWDYAQRNQTEKRIFRTGQSNECIYYDFSGNVGLDKLIAKNIDKKQSLIEYFKSHSIEEIKKEI